MTRQLAVVGKWLTVAIVLVAALLFVVGRLRGYPVVDATLAAITLAVGAIPEGLPAIVIIALVIGVRRMANGTPSSRSGCGRTRGSTPT